MQKISLDDRWKIYNIRHISLVCLPEFDEYFEQSNSTYNTGIQEATEYLKKFYRKQV